MSRRKPKRQPGEHLRREALHKDAVRRFDGMSANEVAALLRGSGDGFLSSPKWKELRRKVIEKHGARCACCGKVPTNPANVNVDHVKPRRFFPELAMDENNLQVLCGRCNKRKGNADTDYRQHRWEGPVTDGEFSDSNISQMLRSLA